MPCTRLNKRLKRAILHNIRLAVIARRSFALKLIKSLALQIREPFGERRRNVSYTRRAQERRLSILHLSWSGFLFTKIEISAQSDMYEYEYRRRIMYVSYMQQYLM